MQIEKSLIAILREYLIVAIPFTILALRLLVRWVAREEPKEIFRGVLTLPLDLMFISMSLVLMGLARLAPKFAARYNSDRDADLSGAILLIILVFLASVLTYMGRGTRVVWQKFYTAWQQLSNRRLQSTFEWGDFSAAGRFLWMLGYWIMMMSILLAQFLISVGSLQYILGLMR